MRIYALSDLHVDFRENRAWLHNLPKGEYRDDLLVLAGDISDATGLLAETFTALTARFAQVLFVPGNHDLWMFRNGAADSMERFAFVKKLSDDHGVITGPFRRGDLTLVPLLGWYDYSFGAPADELALAWMDYAACSWPGGLDDAAVTRRFLDMNEPLPGRGEGRLITFSHFMPRIDLMPSIIPPEKRYLYPVLGTALLEDQIRRIMPDVHIYGHSHVNQWARREGILYVNNAFGYPRETRIARKNLLYIMEG